MYYADIYDKVLFIILVCSSFLNMIYTASMNKAASRFKLLGFAFSIPFILCCGTFVFSSDIPAVLVISFSEFCLSLGFLLLLLHPYNTKNHYIKTILIIILPLVMAVYLIQSAKFFYFSIPTVTRSIVTAICILSSIIYIRKKCRDNNFYIPLSIWLAGILLGLFEGQPYVKELTLALKLIAYASFFRYFYSKTYSSYMKKINESEQLIETMERSLNKEVKKRVFEIERSNERLLEMSKTDLLTKSFNKITILNIIEKLISSKRDEIFSIL
ncbi:MAG TPA: hypothetical protein VD757_00540, partial [Candidatus Nitrosocosmicus sp.]|nr:hypothetical protein [Candidatus Nitrosocosmicus sp.]